MKYPHKARRIWAGAAPIGLALLTLAATVIARAEQGPGGGGAGAMVPMTAATVLRSPAAHMGEKVSMMATVEAVLTKTTFTVDQDKTKSTGNDLLVVAPALATAPDLNTYVTVQGEVMMFDPAEIARKAAGYSLDLPADLVEKFRGKPVVLATAVVTTGLVDLAKKPIAPMTPEELMFKGWMTSINAAFPAMRAGLDPPNATAVKEQAAILKKTFGDVETFFKLRNTADAMKFAVDFQQMAVAVDASAAAGKWDEAKATATTLQGLCASCHGAHRDRMDDGSYRIRAGG